MPFEALAKNGGGDGSRTHVRPALYQRYYVCVFLRFREGMQEAPKPTLPFWLIQTRLPKEEIYLASSIIIIRVSWVNRHTCLQGVQRLSYYSVVAEGNCKSSGNRSNKSCSCSYKSCRSTGHKGHCCVCTYCADRFFTSHNQTRHAPRIHNDTSKAGTPPDFLSKIM